MYQSYPGNSGPYDPYISPILEILDRTIHIFSHPGNLCGYLIFHIVTAVEVGGGGRPGSGLGGWGAEPPGWGGGAPKPASENPKTYLPRILVIC